MSSKVGKGIHLLDYFTYVVKVLFPQLPFKVSSDDKYRIINKVFQ